MRKIQRFKIGVGANYRIFTFQKFSFESHIVINMGLRGIPWSARKSPTIIYGKRINDTHILKNNILNNWDLISKNVFK